MAGKKIDGHRHILCQEALNVAKKLDSERSGMMYSPDIDPRTDEINGEKNVVWARKLTGFDENIADLEMAGMDMAILQPTQTMFFYWAEPSAAADLSRMINEYTARGVRRHPEHFLGLATLPLQDVEAAVKELEYAVQELGLSGVVTGSNVNGHGFDEEQFQPFFEKVEALDVPIVVHPNQPKGIERLGRYYLVNFLGLPLESSIFAARLVFGGVLDRFPNLKICLSHAGGALPFLLGRLEHGQSVRPESQENCKYPFSHYLKNFYVDTITFRPDTLRFVLEIMTEDHVVMGTDYPYDMADTDPVGSVKAAVTDENLREKIFGENLRVLMGMTGIDY